MAVQLMSIQLHPVRMWFVDGRLLRLYRLAGYLLQVCLLLAALTGCHIEPVQQVLAAGVEDRPTNTRHADDDLPVPGVVRRNNAYGTAVVRISDALATLRRDDHGYLPLVTQEYATVSPFNADTRRLLLTHYSYFSLYEADGKYLHDLPMEINASSQPRWSRNDPDIFYYIRDNELRRFDIKTDTGKRVRTFSEYETISGHGESDISEDGDHLVLAGDGREIFVYTLSTDSKGPVLALQPSQAFDNLHITPDNNVIVGWLAQGTDRFSGYELFDSQMQFLHQLSTVVGHADVGRDTDGSEVLLWANGGDPAPPQDCENGVVKITLRTAQHTCLITFDWSLGRHISMADDRDWFVISTYTGTVIPPPEPSPGHLNAILKISLDGRQVQSLARHASQPLNDYVYQPRAAVSRDGTRIVYADNRGRSDKGREYVDTYLLIVPDTALHPAPATAPDAASNSP